MAHIYRIVRVGTDQCYVGHTTMPIGDRWKAHRYHLKAGSHHSSYLQRSWIKYGAAEFIFEVVEQCPDEDKVVREQFYMDTLNSCFNGRPAAESNLGYKYTDEQKARMSLAQQNNPLAGQHRVGFKETPEVTEARMIAVRRALQEKPLIWITDGEDNMRVPSADPIPDEWRLGRTFSEQHHQAREASSSGPRSLEVRAAIKAGHATTWGDPEKRAAMLANRRPFGWWTDGTNSKRVAIDETPPAGWRSGRAIDAQKLFASRSTERKPRNPELEPARIIARLGAGETAAAIALSLGVALSSVHRAANKGGVFLPPTTRFPSAVNAPSKVPFEPAVDRRPEAARKMLSEGEASRRGKTAWDNEESSAALLASRADQCWVTNGSETKRHLKSQPVPDGWRRGRGGLFGRAAAKAKKQAEPEDEHGRLL